MSASILFDACFSDCPEQSLVEVSIGGINRQYRRWLTIEQAEEAFERASGAAMYFGPAIRSATGKMGKANCQGSLVCWVDVDHEEIPLPVLPPTASVWSGHGWHLYWRLDKFEPNIGRLESANKSLAAQVRGDSAHNADRMMRIPGTLNAKDEEELVVCKLVEGHPERVYSIKSLLATSRLDAKMVRKIVTGDRRGFPSRSERDLAIVRALTNVGATDELIQLIFQEHACGDKYRDPRTRSDSYLSRTIETARKSAKEVGARGPRRRGIIEEREDCYYLVGANREQQISTFTFTPTMLLEGDQDSIVGDIRAACTDYIWRDIVLPRSAFTGLHQLNKHLTKVAWVWLGSDADVRGLLAYLVVKLTETGIPRARSVTCIGRHTLPEDPRVFFACDGYTISSDGSVWTGAQDNPLLYVSSGREAPRIGLFPEELPTKEQWQLLTQLLPKLNLPECIWPLLGWYMAAPFKTALEELNYRFPILNVTGTRGSGKTTLLVYVFQRMLGYERPCSYNSNTTHFVSMSLLGSTNAIPIAFSEFRAATSTDFLRYVLLAYDSGRDARGRPDQTTVEYPLVAPFSLDGEDRLDDPAALERIIAITLSPQTIAEGMGAWEAYQALARLHTQVSLQHYAFQYLRYTTQTSPADLLQGAEEAVRKALPMGLPSRIRRNLIVCWFGVLAYKRFLEQLGIQISPPDATILRVCLENTYSTRLGRAPTAADAFVETIVNASAQKTNLFPWSYDVTTQTLWFQLTPAFDYYARQRVMQHRTAGTLSRDAIRIQLRELVSDYTELPRVMEIKGRKALVYGINIYKAHQAGLDLPETFRPRQFIVEV